MILYVKMKILNSVLFTLLFYFEKAKSKKRGTKRGEKNEKTTPRVGSLKVCKL